MSDNLCGCIKCAEARMGENPWVMTLRGFRYSCEKCGNKRCPHHSDHELACTNSNEPGQPGSVFT